MRAIKIYYKIMSPNHLVQDVDNLPPSKIRKLVTDVLKESQIIKSSFEASCRKVEIQTAAFRRSEEKSTVLVPVHRAAVATAETQNNGSQKTTKLSVYEARQINGCLVKTPANFYSDVWFVLLRCKNGIKIKNRLMPQEPTLSNFFG